MKFIDEIHAEIAPIWDRIYEHPFLQEMANGSLPLDKFQFYLIQDHQYLEAFIRLHQVLAKKMPTKEMAQPLLDLIKPGDNEINSLQRVVDAVHIADEQFKTTPLAPVATAYINHMYYQSYFVSPAAGVASLLPCYWTYAECFKKLAKRGTNTSSIYQAFIDFYAGDESQQGTAGIVKLVDQLAERGDRQNRQEMRHAFTLSTDYELMYWQMSYDREQWPHQRYPLL